MVAREIRVDENFQERYLNMSRDFPVTIHYNDFSMWASPRVGWHWHPYLEFDTILKGRVDLFTNHRKVTLQEGEGCLLNINVMHSLNGISEEAPVILTHLVNPSFIAGEEQGTLVRKYLTPVLDCSGLEFLTFSPSSTRQRQILEHMNVSYEAADTEPEGYELIVRSELTAAWLLILQEAKPLLQERKTASGPMEARVKTMMLYIQRNHMNKVTLEQIARSASLSTRECTRDFQTYLHMTPFRYLTDFRLLAASDDIRNTMKPVTMITADHGFSSPSYFTRLFREKYRMTPLEYRAAHRK